MIPQSSGDQIDLHVQAKHRALSNTELKILPIKSGSIDTTQSQWNPWRLTMEQSLRAACIMHASFQRGLGDELKLSAAGLLNLSTTDNVVVELMKGGAGAHPQSWFEIHSAGFGYVIPQSGPIFKSSASHLLHVLKMQKADGGLLFSSSHLLKRRIDWCVTQQGAATLYRLLSGVHVQHDWKPCIKVKGRNVCFYVPWQIWLSVNFKPRWF